MIKSIIVSLFGFASMVSLAFVSSISMSLRIVIMIIGLISFVYLVYQDCIAACGNDRICKSENETNEFMRELIRNQGKVSIMSRDLSWAEDEEVLSVMKEKGSNLTVYMQNETEVSKTLSQKGVKIKYYGFTGFDPMTRYTIIRLNKPSRQLAIANTENTVSRKRKYRHTIHLTNPKDPKDKWIIDIAYDLLDLCNRICKEAPSLEKGN